MKKGLGFYIVCILTLLLGCAGTEDAMPVFEGVRVLMRYDFGIQEYASVDSAQREMERWVEVYNTGTLEDHYAGTISFVEMKDTKEGYQGYLDWGIFLWSADLLSDGIWPGALPADGIGSDFIGDKRAGAICFKRLGPGGPPGGGRSCGAV